MQGRAVSMEDRAARFRRVSVIGRGVLCFAACLALLWGCTEEVPETVVTIDSAPESGATLFIKGGIERVTPAVLEGLPPGQVEVLLKRENFRDTEDVIQVKVGPPQTFVIEMEPLVGYLTVVSTPPGAEVILNGEDRIGLTPLNKYPVKIGEHQYQVRLENYYPYTSDLLDVKADYQYGLNTTVSLRPQEGSIIVTSRPTGAAVWINGARQPQLTPYEFVLAPGKYIIDAHADGYVMDGERVELVPNGSARVSLELKPGRVPHGMVLVPAGPFLRGSKRAPDEQPETEIHLPAFYIDKYEVTNAEFKEVFPGHIYPEGWDNYPVAGVSWTQAVDYAQRVGKRLPTEMEWEKAARGSQGLEFPWGNSFDPSLCNMSDSGERGVAERGKYIEGLSPYGCVDMAGNVYEWTQDWYQAYPGNTVVTKDYGQIFRVLRGGSYQSERFDVRAAKRHYDRVSATRPDYGFRCALDVEPGGGG